MKNKWERKEEELPHSIHFRLHPHRSSQVRPSLFLKYGMISILGPGYVPSQDRRFRVMQLWQNVVGCRAKIRHYTSMRQIKINELFHAAYICSIELIGPICLALGAVRWVWQSNGMLSTENCSAKGKHTHTPLPCRNNEWKAMRIITGFSDRCDGR
jgi:hypothetical protein